MSEDAAVGDRLGLRFRLAEGLERALGEGPVEVVVLDDAR